MRDYSFGNFLHELRMRRGLTQYQLGALVGVSDKAVSKWENGSSKPQSSILYKLSDVLEISVDELLTCKYHSPEKKNTKGIFAMKKQLWDKAFGALHERYGYSVPIEIMNRFLSEYAEMQNTDWIVCFDLLSALVAEAGEHGEHIHLLGGTGSSFIAYLFGASEINPLKPHYYCPHCRIVIFDHNTDDGWDLPKRKCSCGKEMQRDGHNIPFEAYRQVGQTELNCFVSISPNFRKWIKPLFDEYFKDCQVSAIERERDGGIMYTIFSGLKSSKTPVCSFTFLEYVQNERYQALERATATAFDRVDFLSTEILAEFRKCNTDGVIEFDTIFCKNMINEVIPDSFHGLVQIAGLSHGTGVWFNNAKELINQGISVSNVIAYRDDVFNRIEKQIMCKGIVNTGYAYKIMEDTRKGVYFRDGVSDELKKQLKDIEIEDWFIDSIGKIQYLFQKAHGITIVKLAVTLMWYKTHYPKEFSEIML
ncbi:MAG: helix-turn-helix domain-containing protein [Clostridia bacterium]|nr:helix-turn-helix domain-containing protein [Clostridia bacterium]